jgi:hypothetical protein
VLALTPFQKKVNADVADLNGDCRGWARKENPTRGIAFQNLRLSAVSFLDLRKWPGLASNA